MNNIDIVEKITEYEMGLLTNEEVIDLFQYLVTSGIIYSLQGSYQRTAQHYIDAGEIEIPDWDKIK